MKKNTLPTTLPVGGFVFTNDEIVSHLRRKDRLKEADDAAIRRYRGSS